MLKIKAKEVFLSAFIPNLSMINHIQGVLYTGVYKQIKQLNNQPLKAEE